MERLEPRKQPVQRRSKATVEAVLTSAAQVFEELGYAAGTTNRIAERAGVSIGTLYQYFPSKDAVAVALLERHLQETTRRLREWAGHMVAERHGLHGALNDYVEGMLDTHLGWPRLQHILLEETPLPERVHRVLLRAERDAARTVAGLLRLYPEARHRSLERAGFLVVQAVESLTHRFAAHPDEQPMGRTEFAGELVAMLEAYLARGGEPGRTSTRRAGERSSEPAAGGSGGKGDGRRGGGRLTAGQGRSGSPRAVRAWSPSSGRVAECDSRSGSPARPSSRARCLTSCRKEIICYK